MTELNAIPATMLDWTVGLSESRPFRFCTLRYGCGNASFVLPGDDLVPPLEEVAQLTWHAIDVSIPLNPVLNRVNPHNHEFYEIALVREGCVQHSSNDCVEILQRGDVVIITPEGVHEYDLPRGLVITNIYLKPDWLCNSLQLLWNETGLVRFLLADALLGKKFVGGILRLSCSEEEIKFCERELEGIYIEALKPRPSLTLYCAVFLKILWLLNTACTRDERQAMPSLRADLWEAVQVIEQMVQNRQPFSLSKIAKVCGLSRSGSASMFKNETGFSPMNYFQRRRVCLGVEQLVKSEFSITEIAHDLGFADSSHFCRVFRRHMGMNPKAYRELHHVSISARRESTGL